MTAPDPSSQPQKAAGQSGQSAERGQSPERRGRRGWWRRRGLSLLALALSGGLVALYLGFAGRPIELPGWATARIEAQVNTGMKAGRVSLGQMVFQYERVGTARLTLRDVGVFDGSGAEVARLNDVGARLRKRDLLRAEITPERLRLSGAQIVLRRGSDGVLSLSFGGAGGQGVSMAETLARLEAVLGENGALAGLERLEAGALTITLEDARAGRVWQATEGTLLLTQGAEEIALTLGFDVFNGTEELAETRLNFTTRKGAGAAQFGATFRNAAARDIAAQSPALAFLGVLDAPIAGSIRAQFGAGASLSGLSGTLEIGQGALRPSEATRPIRFDRGKSYFTYNPAQEKLTFSELSVETDAARIAGAGHAYLRDYSGGFPTVLLGQFTLADSAVRPGALYETPVELGGGALDFRLRLDPFTMDIGQLSLRRTGDEGTAEHLLARGQVRAGREGWQVKADIEMDAMDQARLLELWPVSIVPNTRKWLNENVIAGELRDIKGAVRLDPGAPARLSLGWTMAEAEVRFLKTLPPVTGGHGYATINDGRYTMVLDEGKIIPSEGGAVDIAGSTMVIPDITIKPARAEIALRTSGDLHGGLALMNLPPFQILRNTAFGPDVAEGQADMAAEIAFDLKKKIALSDVSFEVGGRLSDLSSDALVKGRRITAQSLDLTADPAGIEIDGAAVLGGARFAGKWAQGFGPEAQGKSRIEATATLDQAFVDEFNIALPEGAISGAGVGQVQLDLARGTPPAFSLRSDLNRLGLRLDALGWSKAQNRTGSLAVAGRLTQPASIDALDFEAPGLTATGGRLALKPDGEMDRLSFDKVTLGGWLNAPVTLVGRGRDVAPAVRVQGGSIDIRRADFGSPGSATSGGPITLNLDRLTISEGIALRGFAGEFTQNGGFQGRFSGRVNGGAAISGTLSPSARGPVIAITSSDAGATLRDAGVLENGRGGDLKLTLTPTGATGTYDGKLKVANTRVVGAPGLAELLSAISIIGLLDQLNGPGIAFSDVEAEFRLTPRQAIITGSSAIGPSLGISLDGSYDLANKTVDMQGVISPVYFLNAIGRVVSARRGEGLIGFNFRLTGKAASPKVAVNPLSVLTPGLFREIFRRPPPKVD